MTTDWVPAEPRHVQTFRLFRPTSLAPLPSCAITMQPAVRLQGQLTFPRHKLRVDLTSSAHRHILEAPMESRECKQERILQSAQTAVLWSRTLCKSAVYMQSSLFSPFKIRTGFSERKWKFLTNS